MREPRVPKYTARELSTKTWTDFERLFETHPAPGAYPCGCMYNHRPGPLPESGQRLSSVQRTARNHREKRALVENGCAHGILVYADGEPVGWCQYGSSEELPRIENNSRYRKLAPEGDLKRMWRITCFVVDKQHRNRGVASAALRAALDSIKRKGGGLVEAYPITRQGAYSDFRGTVSMFRKEGFKIVAHFGKDNVVVRRTI